MGSWHRSLFPLLCQLTGVCVIAACGSQDSHAPALADEYHEGGVPRDSGGTGGKSAGGAGGSVDASQDAPKDAAQTGGANSVDATSTGGANSDDATSAGGATISDASAGMDVNTVDALPREDANAAKDSPYVSGCTEGGVPTPEVCSDGIDNDCDGYVDCTDSDCKPTGVAGFGSSCDVGFQSGMKCNWLGACVCSSGHSTESQCDDNEDNDCDGKIDCQDSDCQRGGASGTFACDSFGHTCGDRTDAGQAVCSTCPGGHQNETGLCVGGKDDDCDGKADCEDEDCSGQQCGTSSSQICIGQKCVDLDNDYSIKLTPERLVIPADGTARDPIAIELSNTKSAPIDGKLIDLKISGGGSFYGYSAPDGGGPATTIQIRTDGSGRANATFLSDAAGGTATISAVLAGANTGTIASVDMPVVDTMELMDTKEDRLMGVYGSGYHEERHLTYQLFAPNRLKYPKGLTVSFSHETLHGSALGPPRTDPVVPPGGGTPVSTLAGTTDSDGQVTITVYSGTEAGTASVTASATAAGQTRSLLVSDIVIVGAKASGARGRMILTCAPSNLSAFANLECPNSISKDEAICTVSAADRFGNVLGVAKSVTFMSEAGTMGPPASTPAYSDKSPLGTASTQLKALGPLPKDVDPFPDEPRIHGRWLCNQERTHNPRDGIVTVIATMQGEEGFTDVNKNGQWDPGEPFIDLPEPFVDVNDDNEYTVGEPYIDVGGTRGAWDGPNGKWDANTTIWVQTRVAFTSAASGVLSGYGAAPWSIVNGGTPILPDAGAEVETQQIHLKQSTPLDFYFTDMNFNALPPPPRTTYSAETHGAIESPDLTPVLGDVPGDHGFVSGVKYCVADGDGGYSCDDDCYAGPVCTVRSFLGSYTPYATGTVWLPNDTVGSYQLKTTATVAGVSLSLIRLCQVSP